MIGRVDYKLVYKNQSKSIYYLRNPQDIYL